MKLSKRRRSAAIAYSTRSKIKRPLLLSIISTGPFVTGCYVCVYVFRLTSSYYWCYKFVITIAVYYFSFVHCYFQFILVLSLIRWIKIIYTVSPTLQHLSHLRRYRASCHQYYSHTDGAESQTRSSIFAQTWPLPFFIHCLIHFYLHKTDRLTTAYRLMWWNGYSKSTIQHRFKITIYPGPLASWTPGLLDSWTTGAELGVKINSRADYPSSPLHYRMSRRVLSDASRITIFFYCPLWSADGLCRNGHPACYVIPGLKGHRYCPSETSGKYNHVNKVCSLEFHSREIWEF